MSYYDSVKLYSSGNIKTKNYLKSKEISVGIKMRYIFFKFLHNISNLLHLKRGVARFDNLSYIKSIIKKEKPNLVVFFTFNPCKSYAKYCKAENIPYISVLYDTYIGRPELNIDKAYRLEEFVIKNAKGYFVPNFFYDLYREVYRFNNIYSFNLPLLIEKYDVINAYQNRVKKADFAYFGQIQSFRNGEAVKGILSNLKIKLDVFSTNKYQSDNTFIVHPAVTKNELYEIVAGSKFLVAMDNSVPYQNYLPSKAYLYASFTKPIIAFGDNQDSALISFFKDYPNFFYQNINQPVDGLVEFLGKNFSDTFDENCYSKYLQYLPKTALNPLIECINKSLI